VVSRISVDLRGIGELDGEQREGLECGGDARFGYRHREQRMSQPAARVWGWRRVTTGWDRARKDVRMLGI
jgi:hypothetical protein